MTRTHTSLSTVRRGAAALILAALVLGGGMPAAGFAQPTAPIPFGPGERLQFAVKYGFVHAGNAVLAVETEPGAAEPALRLLSTAESSRFFETFFPVHDRVISVWSPVSRLPLRFEKHIREGKYAKDETVRFDHEAGTAVDQKGNLDRILPGAQDVLSAFYFVRTLPLRVGETVEVPNYADGKNYPLQVSVLRRETVEVPAGKFRCLVVEPLLRTAGLFKQEGSLTIWLTDDARRMPVLMKSKVTVGSIAAELESFRVGRAACAPAAPVGAAADPRDGHR